MDQGMVTLVAAGVGVGGALVGIVIGHFLTRNSQHKQWLLDNRKEEFRQLVSALTEATVEHLAYILSQGTSEPEPRSIWMVAQKRAFCAITDRVYIASDIDKIDASNRYMTLSEKLKTADEDYEPITKDINILINEIIAVAKKG